MARFSQSLIGLLTAATMTASLGASAPSGAQEGFRYRLDHLCRWMPWPMRPKPARQEWGDKYGINIKITQINDYVESINQYTAGKFDASLSPT